MASAGQAQLDRRLVPGLLRRPTRQRAGLTVPRAGGSPNRTELMTLTATNLLGQTRRRSRPIRPHTADVGPDAEAIWRRRRTTEALLPFEDALLITNPGGVLSRLSWSRRPSTTAAANQLMKQCAQQGNSWPCASAGRQKSLPLRAGGRRSAASVAAQQRRSISQQPLRVDDGHG